MYRDKLPDEAVDEVWQRFRDALMPLHSAGKLGAVLFQFPQWFVISKKNKAYIEECAARLPDYRVAIEFRNETWMSERNREESLSFLEERKLPFVCVDMPQGFVSSIPPIAAATADDLAMVRFHGRDPQAWSTKSESASVRFRYDYKQEELAEWVPRIQQLASDTRETHVLMNNCYRDFAVRNASELGNLLRRESSIDIIALGSIHAELRGADDAMSFRLNPKTLAADDRFTFATDLGDVDCLAIPAGALGYRRPGEVRGRCRPRQAVLVVAVASIDDLIR